MISKCYGYKGGRMELLERLQREGFDVILGDNNRIGIKPKERVTPGLAKQIRAHKSQIIEALRKQKRADQYGKPERRYCEGYEPPRYVHPEVCAWHIQEADLHCANCRYLTRKDKETFMDSYLNAAIAKLNAEGAVYYEPGDSQARRQRIYDLERQITRAFLIHDINSFVKAVDEWQKTFFNGGVL